METVPLCKTSGLWHFSGSELTKGTEKVRYALTVSFTHETYGSGAV
jgi:hypothetical protein